MANNNTLEKQPPLHVELSKPATGCLRRIQKARAWNKKTAVEAALTFFWLHGDKADFIAAGSK